MPSEPIGSGENIVSTFFLVARVPASPAIWTKRLSVAAPRRLITYHDTGIFDLRARDVPTNLANLSSVRGVDFVG
jgi:hypothetical protein